MSSELVEVLEAGEVYQPAFMNRGAVAMPAFSGGLYGLFLKQLDVSPKTQETYTRNLKQFFVWLNERGIAQPTRDHVIAYRDELKATRKPSTVQSYMAVVRIFFQWTESEKIYPNIAHRVKSVKQQAKDERTHEKDALHPAQVERVLKTFDRGTLQGCRDFALFTLLVTCGLRTIEAVRANVGDLRNGTECARLFVQGKGKDYQAPVNVSPEVEGFLRDYLAKRGKAEPDAPLFASISNKNAGGRMTTRSISRIIKEALKNAGFDSDRLTAHSLRHTAVTTFLRNGATLREAQEMARHASPETTAIYAHTEQREKNQGTRVNARILLKGF